MDITRRQFHKYCVAYAGMLGLGASALKRLDAALGSDQVPTVIWLHGSGCQGDSISFLNRIDVSAPTGQRTVDDILFNSVNLAYHTVIMAGTGETALTMAKQTLNHGPYILALEGGVPRAFGGRACRIGSYEGQDITYEQAVKDFSGGAAAVVCVGTCAAYGGIPRSGRNRTGIVSVKEAIERDVINIPGCPAHPDWITWTLVQLLLGNPIKLDAHDRPLYLYGDNLHDNCPRLDNEKATTFGQDHQCLLDLGCRAKTVHSDCWRRKWNNASNWCVDSNGMCLGCTEPDFPGGDFYL
jgi:hydrogenase small subunit